MAKENLFRSYVRSAVEIMNQFDGTLPLAPFLRNYFSHHAKLGSRDRRQISSLCYGAYRLGKLARSMPPEEAIIAGQFLLSDTSNPFLSIFRPELNEKVSESPEEKITRLGCEISAVFPWKNALSAGVDHALFCRSFFVQPDLFIRLRPGFAQTVIAKLQAAVIPFEVVSETCLALPNGTKLENVLDIDREAVIQDLSSQQTTKLLDNYKPQTTNHKLKVWDCCAASGGKSILLKDTLGDFDLVVSDVRESILSNLKKRFDRAGIRNYSSYLLDLTTNNGQLPTGDFDLILADVPCTGSGTWSRTPEQLYFFDEDLVTQYVSVQRNILANVVKQMRPGAFLFYITCSVFKAENEEQISWLVDEQGLAREGSRMFTGYERRADSLFAALLSMPL